MVARLSLGADGILAQSEGDFVDYFVGYAGDPEFEITGIEEIERFRFWPNQYQSSRGQGGGKGLAILKTPRVVTFRPGVRRQPLRVEFIGLMIDSPVAHEGEGKVIICLTGKAVAGIVRECLVPADMQWLDALSHHLLEELARTRSAFRWLMG